MSVAFFLGAGCLSIALKGTQAIGRKKKQNLGFLCCFCCCLVGPRFETEVRSIETPGCRSMKI